MAKRGSAWPAVPRTWHRQACDACPGASADERVRRRTAGPAAGTTVRDGALVNRLAGLYLRPLAASPLNDVPRCLSGAALRLSEAPEFDGPTRRAVAGLAGKLPLAAGQIEPARQALASADAAAGRPGLLPAAQLVMSQAAKSPGSLPLRPTAERRWAGAPSIRWTPRPGPRWHRWQRPPACPCKRKGRVPRAPGRCGRPGRSSRGCAPRGATPRPVAARTDRAAGDRHRLRDWQRHGPDERASAPADR